jgi:hypothetical protein
MSTYIGEVMSSISFRSNALGANGTRTKQVFTRFGWCEVRHPYRVGNPEESDVFKTFGIERKMTKAALKVAARILVARRCKQAGMHWRHHNTACICAIIAKLRNAT